MRGAVHLNRLSGVALVVVFARALVNPSHPRKRPQSTPSTKQFTPGAHTSHQSHSSPLPPRTARIPVRRPWRGAVADGTAADVSPSGLR